MFSLKIVRKSTLVELNRENFYLKDENARFEKSINDISTYCKYLKDENARFEKLINDISPYCKYLEDENAKLKTTIAEMKELHSKAKSSETVAKPKTKKKS